MFEKLDLKKTIDDETFEKPIGDLKERLSILQRTLRDLNIPVIIVLEGWNAAGITMSIHEIILSLDPRGFNLHAIDNPSDEEEARPFLWRFWLRTPSNGRISIFARSWYSRALAEKLSGIGWKKSMKDEITSINNFERQLADNGTIIIKFFLHISKDDQKMRLLVRERNPLTAWLVTPKIWNFHHHYETYLPVIEEFIENTDTVYAPWHVIDATDRKYTILKIYTALVKTLEKKIAETQAGQSRKSKTKSTAKPQKTPVHRRTSSESPHSKEECQDLLNNLQIEMLELHYLLFKRKIPFIIAYEGWDAAGKGGNIMRVARYMNPLGYDVIPVAAPTQNEKQYHYLRRFIKHFPRAGHIAIYDRSWYGRVLVERVEGFCSENEWQRAYQEINEMEQDYVESSGGGMVKFWLEIDKDEQLKRFKQRQDDPLKQYKITKEDWRNREKWDQYDSAVDEMLARTNTPYAPWVVIESDDKWYARVKALKTVIKNIEKLL
ncbi:MAG: polyphosphate:AMP phosphotransferase [Methanoregula sp.]|nr:polyphosphate:AMP phosphotransferase [Methanoregula sp.]